MKILSVLLVIAIMIWFIPKSQEQRRKLADSNRVQTSISESEINKKDTEKWKLFAKARNNQDTMLKQIARKAVREKTKPIVKRLTKTVTLIDTQYVFVPCPDDLERRVTKLTNPPRLVPVLIKDTIIIKKKTLVGEILQSIFKSKK